MYSSTAKDVVWLKQDSRNNIISLDDPRYPEILKKIAYPPQNLYVRGNYESLQQPQIAIVGSRRPSEAGIVQAKRFAKQLAEMGFVINSGLALGIDAASHLGALSAEHGQTVAVLGHGLHTIYPRNNNKLAADILERGCLVSEYPFGTAAHAAHFPQRNRIISGMSVGVLVVEAALQSGSLITARFAMEQGREVFAIPGCIASHNAKGCHNLIREGAKLVDKPEDILEEVASLLNFVFHDKSANTTRFKSKLPNLSGQQELLLQKVDYAATSVDSIVFRTGLAINVVNAILLELELLGLVAPTIGGYKRNQ